MGAPGKTSREIFEQAWTIENSDQRHAFVEEACGSDAALLNELEGLLRAHDTAGRFLGNPNPPSGPIIAEASENVGDQIGRYRLLRKIGEGGCGVVYEAEQQEPVRRRVALKVIKSGMDTRSVIARFEAERQALALMDHPGIARVFDAGASETGRPFFAMELVPRIKITDFCEQNALSAVERLNLFVQVCLAVQHAHQKGIIHRDIKPSNILVTLHDGVPVPKVVDFGIAKATEGRLKDATVCTQLHQFIGTPAYMSPEQTEMSGLDIDTRSDIYSLGVLLYELLTGTTPFDGQELMSQGLDAMRRTIREEEPPRPSTRLTSLARNLNPCPSADSPIRIPPSAIDPDLDWIVLKALEKDRTRRYATANALAMDIQRHLANEPVLARPPSRTYLLRKFVRRHRPEFAIGIAVAVLVVSGIVFVVRDAVRTRTAEKVQRDLRAKAESNQRQAEFARNETDAANQILKRNLFIREWLDAERLLDDGKIAPALAWFSRSAREYPGDVAVQTRLLSLLTEGSFVTSADRPMLTARLSIMPPFFRMAGIWPPRRVTALSVSGR